MAASEELKLEAALFALAKALRDWKRELRRIRREHRELHDDEEDEGWP